MKRDIHYCKHKKKHILLLLSNKKSEGWLRFFYCRYSGCGKLQFIC
jgi:hypothetical protein